MTNDILFDDFGTKIDVLKEARRSILNEHQELRNEIGSTFDFINTFDLRLEASAYKTKAILRLEQYRNKKLDTVKEKLKELLDGVI